MLIVTDENYYPLPGATDEADLLDMGFSTCQNTASCLASGAQGMIIEFSSANDAEIKSHSKMRKI